MHSCQGRSSATPSKTHLRSVQVLLSSVVHLDLATWVSDAARMNSWLEVATFSCPHMQLNGITPEDISTTSVSVSPNTNYNPTTGASVPNGFGFQNSISVTVRRQSYCIASLNKFEARFLLPGPDHLRWLLGMSATTHMRIQLCNVCACAGQQCHERPAG